ncbi:hypothetical protein [Nonlabens ulvanivorans]|uniref:Lipoprotein n=1 Tax=Nonlabens ulvanivorans TaxID=906888 RepID=A0A084JUV1_NONUL|nr:hypothetical protein [Nonlabens ulvanivorans]KEZ92735.1 hypothetical protein IL45_11390 [Nonlabens ulvanivorans]PRX15582.1 hypothetical protein LY02_00802 [Nonlabens ulvanivorans]
MKILKTLIACLLLIACTTDDAPPQESLLPPITMTGENTFGCLIDGEFFKPRDGQSTINSENKGLRVVQTETDNWEIHVFDRKSNKTKSLYIHLEDYFINKEGRYEIGAANGLRGVDGPNNNYLYGSFWNSAIGDYSNYHSFEGSGSIEVIEDNQDSGNFYIISGVFQAKLLNIENPMDSLIISQGHFDIESISLQSTSFD